jgi:hypothetical protein
LPYYQLGVGHFFVLLAKTTKFLVAERTSLALRIEIGSGLDSEETSVKIVWEPSVYFGSAPVFCTLCGQEARPIRSGANQLLIGVIYDCHDVVWGEACHHCIALGSEGIKALLGSRIETLRSKLSDLEALAQGELQVPSIEQEFQMHRRDGS